jgi:2-C-methyl-D-erythritol 4-phosphate cytidylyltransferase
VLIHDGARPFTCRKVILKVIESLKKYPAVICGVKPKDTVKLIEGGYTQKTLNRNELFLVQTPQGFRKDLIFDAYNKLKVKNIFDDAQVLEMIGKKVRVVSSEAFNFKITYPEDVELAKAIIKSREI